MPNKPKRHKAKRSQFRRGAVQRVTKPRSAGDLLAEKLAKITKSAQSRPHESIELIQARLPLPLQPHVRHAQERNGVLLITTASAAWSTRLRFALAEIEPEIRRLWPAIQRVEIRVAPGRSAGSAE
jgi:hypothetical protein